MRVGPGSGVGFRGPKSRPVFPRHPHWGASKLTSFPRSKLAFSRAQNFEKLPVYVQNDLLPKRVPALANLKCFRSRTAGRRWQPTDLFPRFVPK